MFTSAQTEKRRLVRFVPGTLCLVRHRSRAVLISMWICGNRELMEPSAANGFAALPNGVLIVEDDPIIALDCEDTILAFGRARHDRRPRAGFCAARCRADPRK